MGVFLQVIDGEDTIFDSAGQSWYKREPRMESAMECRLLAAGVLGILLVSNLAHAQHFEIEPVMYRGDRNGSLEAGTIQKVAAPLLVARSGEKSSLLMGGSVPVTTPKGITFVSVGRQVHVKTASVDGGGIKVEATLEHNEVAGKGPQIARSEASTTTTIQSGGKIRIELGKDPKDQTWVEVTVRKVKR
jgi:hypothetical protein